MLELLLDLMLNDHLIFFERQWDFYSVDFEFTENNKKLRQEHLHNLKLNIVQLSLVNVSVIQNTGDEDFYLSSSWLGVYEFGFYIHLLYYCVSKFFQGWMVSISSKITAPLSATGCCIGFLKISTTQIARESTLKYIIGD